MRSLASRFVLAIWRGPISRNLGGAVGTQLCLLVSGTVAARLLGPQHRGYLAILTLWPSAIGQIGAVGMSLAATYFLASNQIGGPELIALLRRPALIQIALLTSINVYEGARDCRFWNLAQDIHARLRRPRNGRSTRVPVG
jgi:hypothetical protein